MKRAGRSKRPGAPILAVEAPASVLEEWEDLATSYEAAARDAAERDGDQAAELAAKAKELRARIEIRRIAPLPRDRRFQHR